MAWIDSWSHGWVLFAAIALVFWGASGITQKLSTNRISSELSFLWFACAIIVISAVMALTVRVQWHLPMLMFWMAVAGGALNGLGALTSFAALESGGKASIVISLISLFPLVTVALAIVFLRERMTVRQAAGVAVALTAAILLSMEPDAAQLTPTVRQGSE
jgi:transporter family protein